MKEREKVKERDTILVTCEMYLFKESSCLLEVLQLGAHVRYLQQTLVGRSRRQDKKEGRRLQVRATRRAVASLDSHPTESSPR